MPRTKLIATLGPSLDDPQLLRAAIAGGIDVVRLNFSHGTIEDHARRLGQAREIAEELGRPLGSFGDLQGPKIRLGLVPDEGVSVSDGGEVVLVSGAEQLDSYEQDGTPLLPVVYEHLAQDVEQGAMVLLDDGMLRLVVVAVEGDRVVTRVVAGGLVRSRKGVNLPGVEVSAASLTDKDRDDVADMIELGVNWIALSFVRRPDDVLQLRAHIEQLGGDQPIIAKLERPEAIDQLAEIVAASDAVMVARGDLGVEIGPERVPTIQKRMIDLSNQRGRPVITATEMLQSMMDSPRPTRAEASDVANAVFDGTDAVMLSGETAAGRFPVEAVRTMARIVVEAEAAAEQSRTVAPTTGTVFGRVMAKAATQVAEDVGAVAVLVFTVSGASVVRVSKHRPAQPLLALTTSERTLQRLPLLWGTIGVMVEATGQAEQLIESADRVCTEQRIGQPGDPIVIVAGRPGGRGGTNRVIVHRLGEPVR